MNEKINIGDLNIGVMDGVRFGVIIVKVVYNYGKNKEKKDS